MRFENCWHPESIEGVYCIGITKTDEHGQTIAKQEPGFKPEADGRIQQCTACKGLRMKGCSGWHRNGQGLMEALIGI